MKQFISYISIALLLVSCSDSEELISNDSKTPLAISGVTTIEDNDGAQSRAVLEAGTLSSGSIGLFFRESDKETYDGSTFSNVKYTYGSSWAFESTTGATSAIMLSSTTGTLYAYYPYNASASLTSIPLSASINGDDVCYCSVADVNDHNNAAPSLSMSHALSRIDVTIAKDDVYPGAATLTGIKISGSNVSNSGTLDATTGKITATAADFSVSGLSYACGTTIPCLVVPVSSTASDVTITCTIDGGTLSTTLSSLALEPGKKTTATITVTDYRGGDPGGSRAK